MYSENGRRTTRRANDEFLRRMVGGDLTGGDLGVMNLLPPTMENRPNDLPGCNGEDGGAPDECPIALRAPSLAMVYAPRQCFRNLMDHQTALQNGTLFAELAMPFEAARHKNGREGV